MKSSLLIVEWHLFPRLVVLLITILQGTDVGRIVLITTN